MKNVAERVGKATDEKVRAQGVTMLKRLDEALKATSKEIHEINEERQTLINKQKPAPPSDNEEDDEEETTKETATAEAKAEATVAEEKDDAEAEIVEIMSDD